jgi:hypothetical protein
MQTASRFQPAHTLTRTAAPADPFAERYGVALPAGLRPEAGGLDWQQFLDTYCPTAGPARLGTWSAHRCGAGMWRYEATLTLGERTAAYAVTATGPVAALTWMLHESGRGVEILDFHQYRANEGMATFVRCERDGRRHWAAAVAADGTESALRAVVAAANILD